MKTLKNQYLLFLVGVMAVSMLVIWCAMSIRSVYGNVTNVAPANISTFNTYTFFATSTASQGLASTADVYATSSNATSTNITQWFDNTGTLDKGYFVIAGAKSVEVYFGRGATTTTSSNPVKYTIQGSPDGTNWYDFPKLVLASSTVKTTNAQVFQTTSTTTVPVALELSNDNWYAIRCIVSYQNASAVASGSPVDGKIFCSATASY